MLPFNKKSFDKKKAIFFLVFTAVGGALWVYFIPLPAAVWVGLIPIVIIERVAFTIGIVATYLAFNNAFYSLNEKRFFPYQLPVQREYVWLAARSSIT